VERGVLSDLPLFPARASTIGAGVDHLFFYLVAVALVFSTLIFGLVFYFAIRYRRRSPADKATQITSSVPLEIAWTVIPLCLSAVMFFWGASLFLRHAIAPPGSADIYVVGKQWMWKVQHPEGRREINELHVPVGRPFRLIMTSEDAIHSFFVPAFRLKQDVLPGRFTTLWFQATQVGRYHLFCSQYCGTNHSLMGGWIEVMEPVEYEHWLSRGSTGDPMQVAGAKLFERLGCSNCHQSTNQGRGPSLEGLYGRRVLLEGGGTTIADDAYIEESILKPATKVTRGYQPIMPTFQGQISEEGVFQIIVFLRSLKGERTPVVQ
jgi:cytochrome c oxidase subunit 2